MNEISPPLHDILCTNSLHNIQTIHLTHPQECLALSNWFSHLEKAKSGPLDSDDDQGDLQDANEESSLQVLREKFVILPPFVVQIQNISILEALCAHHEPITAC